MCGITGYLDLKCQTREDVLKNMTRSLYHRGPDGGGTMNKIVKGTQVGMGHRRLSVIDLSEGAKQPMQRGDVTVIFNGEIYNYQEIRSELVDLGFIFSTTSDTEVLIQSYRAWGMECLGKFHGMFAFALLDEEINHLFLCRDRIGIKPLFYYQYNNLLLFASELKSIHLHPGFIKEIDKNSVALYFAYGYVPNPKSIFNHTHKVAPGSYLEIDICSISFTQNVYWSPSNILLNENYPDYKDESEILNELDGILHRAFSYRMVADVPVGIFLSGGYDSSIIAAILQANYDQKIDTYTIGFEERQYDESQHARNVAKYLKTNHQEFICSVDDAKAIIPRLAYYYDEPFADSSAIPTFLVSEVTSQHLKVALSGDGGDELFAGYKRNTRFLSINNQISQLPTKVRSGVAAISYLGEYLIKDFRRREKLRKGINILKDPHLLNIFDQYPRSFTDKGLQKELALSVSENPLLDLQDPLRNASDKFNALLAMDYTTTLSNDMLVKVDRSSMANSLEARDPLLDHSIYEYLARVPSHLKMKDGIRKYLLKKLTHRYIPREIMRRPKMGFGIPIESWLKSDLKWLVDDYLSYDNIGKYGVLDTERAVGIIQQSLRKDYPGSNHLWLMLQFQMWCHQWL